MPYFSTNDKLPSGFSEKDCPLFKVNCWHDSDWEESKHKIMFVIQHVDTADIKAKAIVSTSPVKETFEGILELAKDYSQRVTGTRPKASRAVVNFNFFKSYHLPSDQYESACEASAKRVKLLIKKLKPDFVVVFGDEAAGYLAEGVTSYRYKRGQVHQQKGYKLVTTIGFENTYAARKDEADEKDDELEETASYEDQYENAVTNANLIGYISRCVSSAYSKRLLYETEVKVKPVYVDTIEKFDSLYAELMDARRVSVDTETEGLYTYGNKILTFQFAMNRKRGYVLPYLHKDSPFSAKELAYIKTKLGKFFGRQDVTDRHYLIGQNFGYDLRLIRQEFCLHVIFWKIYDITGGEFGLDENIKMLRFSGTRPYELHHIAARYGINWYLDDAEFGKADRKFIKDRDLNKDVLLYCAADVVIPFAIHEQQLERSRVIDFDGKSYEKMFLQWVLGVNSCQVKVMSTMEHRGAQLDLKEFMRLLSEDGPVNKRLKEATAELYKLEAVQKANRILSGNKGIPEKGMFGSVASWVFDVSTVDHKKTLFFTVMKLKALREGKNGPSMDKFFQKAYKEHREIQLLSEIQRLNTIRNTYVIGWYNRLSQDPDGSVDARIRPRYGYTPVVTGRSNSTAPNLQNVPQHSAEAKYIKRLFVAPPGYLKDDADYKAHEVRGWGIISFDSAVAKAFQHCLNVTWAFRRNPCEETYMVFEKESDIHKVNYSLYTGVPIQEVTGEQRQDSKGIVFGSIYGMSMKSLAAQIKKALEETQKISDKFFGMFKRAKKWLDFAVSHTAKKGYMFSPLGRRRNLQGYVVPVQALRSAMERRGRNSPIQGMGSDFGFIAGQLYAEAMFDFLSNCKVLSNKEFFDYMGIEMPAFAKNEAFSPAGIDSMVHDSLKGQTRYDLIYVSQYLKEWAMTAGVRDYVKKWFGLEFNVELDIEIELGAAADKMTKWFWNTTDVTFQKSVEKEVATETKDKKGNVTVVKSKVKTTEDVLIPSMDSIIRKSMERQHAEFGMSYDIDRAFKVMRRTWEVNKDYLMKKYETPYETWRRAQ